MRSRRTRSRRRTGSDSVRKPSSEAKAPAKLAPQDLEILMRRAKARGDLYEIFSLLFQEAPSPELLAIFKHSDFLQIVRLLLSPETLAKWERFASGKMPLNHLQARLRLEYNNMFLLPTSQRVVPRESAFYHEPAQPQAAQKRLEDVQKFFRRIGMNPLAKFKKEPDHLSQVMHFMSVLCEREKEHLRKNNTAQLGTTCQIQTDFVEKHLAPWIPLMRERMHRVTRFLFFRNVAELMEEFVLSDAEWTRGLKIRYGVKKGRETPAKAPPAPKAPARKRAAARGGAAKGAPAKAAGARPPAAEGTPGEKRPRKRRRGGRRRPPKKSASA